MSAASVQQQHHHRSTTKSPHRPFKSRHATKGNLRDLAKGKVEKGIGSNKKSRHQQTISKINRRHQARQKLLTKQRDHAQITNVFSGQKGAPRIVSVVPLSTDCDPRLAIDTLNKCLEIDTELGNGPVTIEIERFKQKLQYIPATRETISALNSCRAADFVVLILSATEEVDHAGESLLRAIESQGISTVLTVVQGLEQIQLGKKRTQIASSLKSFISHFFPSQDKVHSLDSPQECVNLVRTLCTSTPRGIRWREQRSWLVVEQIKEEGRVSDGSGQGTTSIALRGVVRGKGMKANRLLQLGDYGTFQIEKIVAAPAARGTKRKAADMSVEMDLAEQILESPDADQDELAELAPEEIEMNEGDVQPSEAPVERKGVLLDDHHYFSDDEPQPALHPKRLPKGTSQYQSAWYLDDVSYSGSDIDSDSEDEEMEDEGEDMAHQINDGGSVAVTMADGTEAAPSEYPQSEMFIDRPVDEEADDLAAYRQSRKAEGEEDLEFPDEIELHPNVLARDRLARYRGLKSLKTSTWDQSEDAGHEPEDWNRLLRIADYKGAKARAVNEALLGGVAPGSRVDVHLRDVPASLLEQMQTNQCLVAFSLLRHEQKRVVTNVSFTLDSEYPVPLKSKEEIVVQYGPRRFLINPLFSTTGQSPNNVHKYDRFLHPGRTSMATFVAPLTWGAAPAIFFHRSVASTTATEIRDGGSVAGKLEFIGTGTVQAPDQDRVVAKRVILTGHPYKIHKKVVTVRYMFFNKDDVRWFKALQLWTRRGRSGFIKESLGTHGYFKANFDAKINPQDSVAVSLYKRVFPRTAKPLPATGAGIHGGSQDAMAVE